MNKFVRLTWIMLKSGTESVTQNKNKKIKGTLIYILIAIAFLPIAFSIGQLSSKLYDVLSQINQQGTLLFLSYTIISLIIMFFGVFYVLSIFYFSKDVEFYLPLPLRPMEIVGAKFLVAVIYEYIIESLFLIPVIISFGIKSGGGILYYLISIIIFLTIPIIPLIISSLLSMVLMRFTNIGKNKDRFKVISSVILIVIIFGFNTYINKFTSENMTPEHIKQILLEGNDSIINSMNTVFYNTKLAAQSIINIGTVEGIINIFIYLIMVVVAIILFLIFAQKFYFKGVIGVNQSASKRKKLNEIDIDKGTKITSTTMSLVRNELRALIRTPVYFINCIMINFIWPIFLIVPLFLQSEGLSELEKYKSFINSGNSTSTILAVAFLFSIFITSTNSITSTTISREGQNLFFYKFIPINYKKQIKARLYLGIIVGIIGSLMMILVGKIILGIDLYTIILACFMSGVGIVLSAEIGLIIDIYFPKLVWDNEQKAVKQNINSLINMALGTALGALILYLVIKFNLSVVAVALIIVLGMGSLMSALYYILMTKAVKQFKNLEN